MGYWINEDSAQSRIHEQSCRIAQQWKNYGKKPEDGAWHYFEDYTVARNTFPRAKGCKICRPGPATGKNE